MKIINYNPQIFNQTKQHYKLNDVQFDIYNRLNKHNFSKDYFLVDRTGSIPHFLDIDYSYSPIPKNTNFNLDFHTIVKNRCIELLSLGKQINVSWSGGIDSTFVLFSLYHYANDPDQIQVYGTYNSIIESGDLFDKFIKNRMKYYIRTNSTQRLNFNDENSIYVTGSMANQLFTPGLTYNKYRDNLLEFKQNNIVGEHDKYCEYLATVANNPYTSVLTDECLEFLTPSITNSPKKIETLQDLRWYILFNYKWYDVLTYNFIGLDKNVKDRVHAFFNTDQFQLWSINNYVSEDEDHKLDRKVMRDSITEYIGHSYYSNNKIKFTSVMSPAPNLWLYFLNDHTTVFYDIKE